MCKDLYKMHFPFTATYFLLTRSLCTAAFLQCTLPDYINLTSADICIPFRSEYMLAILNDYFTSHLRIVRLVFSISDDVALKLSFKTVEMCLQCIAMADVFDNWLFDTIILYQVFSRMVLKRLSFSSDSKHRVSSSCGEKHDKNLLQ